MDLAELLGLGLRTYGIYVLVMLVIAGLFLRYLIRRLDR